ncbi:MAG TPA: ATPase, T2SS/T4P/T4SS family [Gemmatimonadaceae bacterium]|jgi:P-type conjugative transfer ATPase TrbB|nr:ATPase, T2SS/T4P/T4SS family [Gemmatimonadaceae bacterium]
MEDEIACVGRYAGLVAALDDPLVTEVSLNPQDGALWVERRGVGRARVDAGLSAGQVEMFLNCVAASIDVTLGAATPCLQATLAGGARLQGFMPPVTTGPAFTIRLRSAVVYTLDHWALGASQLAAVRACVADRRSILVAGGTNSGKTTFANSLLHEMHRATPDDRVVVLEDTAELRPPSDNHLLLRTPPGGTLRELVRATLRTSPDRIVVGEVRDAAALELLDAWTTGHPGGCATVHAETALGALRRVDRLAQRAGVPPQPELVAEAVALVVITSGGAQGRRVSAVTRVTGLDRRRDFVLEPID